MMISESGPLLEAQAVSFSYSGQETPLIVDISLKIFPSEVFCLLGPSGAGKTTLLKTLSGLLAPLSGSILFNQRLCDFSQKVERKKFAQEVGVSFQKGGLLDWLTVKENIDFALTELSSLTQKEREETLERVLESVGLKESQELNLRQLSGGMLKRLSIARAMVLKPKVLLLDDPTAGLDPVTSHEIVELIRRFQKAQNAAIFLVTSDLSVAFSLADKMGFLWQGKILCQASALAFQNSPERAVQQFLRGQIEGPLTDVNHA